MPPTARIGIAIEKSVLAFFTRTEHGLAREIGEQVEAIGDATPERC
jgi:hypothetical protein